LISANAKLTISVSNAAGIFDTNFGIILEAIELLGITLLNVTGPSPDGNSPLPVFVPSPTTLTTFVHI
jgi:hypothetical protein